MTIPSHPTNADLLTKSWQRCISSHHLDPSEEWSANVVSGAEFRHISMQSSLLMRASIPETRRLFGLVRDMGLMVVLSDRNATVLSRCFDECHIATCRRIHLQEGAIWSETDAGTNGLGTALMDRVPVSLNQGEHWRYCFASIASYAAPVFDAQGCLSGALALSTPKGQMVRQATPLLLDTILRSCRQIEENLFRMSYADHKILTLGSANGCSALLVSIDDNGELTGATYAARRFMNWTDNTIQRQLHLLEQLQSHEHISFRKAEESVVRSALAVMQGNVTATAKSLGISRATLYRKMKSLGVT